MTTEPLCKIGDIVQYDWDKDDNIFLITYVSNDGDGYLYYTISLINGRETTYQFGLAPLKVIA